MTETPTAPESTEERERRNRTQQHADQTGAITAKGMPEKMANITLHPYRQGMTTVENNGAYLQPILPELTEKLRFEDGMLWFEGMEASRARLEEWFDKSRQTITSIDLPVLRTIYGIILNDVQVNVTTPEELMKLALDPKYIGRMTQMYVPDFMKCMGGVPTYTEKDAKWAVDKLSSFRNILGCIDDPRDKRKGGIYSVLIFSHFDRKTNTVHFSSPYINLLIATILRKGIQTDKNNVPKLKKNGTPFMLPTHSYNVKSTIASERNKRAVEIVFVIDALIAETGPHNTPHIKISTLIDRVPDLKYALDDAEDHRRKNTILKRAFTKAWELLETQTDLKANYKNIQFPTIIPTITKLDTVLEFPHEGRISKKGENADTVPVSDK